MKSLLKLHLSVTQDLGNLLGVAYQRDLQTMEARWSAEGDSFLTISLPSFEDGLLQSIENGHASPAFFPNFRSRGCLPVFLRGFTERIFSTADGSIRVDADSEAVRAVRQICCLSKKVEREVSLDRLRAAERQYRNTDADVLNTFDPFWLKHLKVVFDRLFAPILWDLEEAIASFSLIPRHGPGAVVDCKSQRQKWEDMKWFESIEPVFPSNLYMSFGQRLFKGQSYGPGTEPPVKVIFVPKTMKTPRVIAIEPACRQFVQQAISRHLYRSLRRRFPANLDLFDQKTNQAWAWEGSMTGDVATLDLSEASDRLGFELVRSLFGTYPHVWDALKAARTPTAITPDGSLVHLNKFASMGSALTFPIQSMVFFAIAVLGSQPDPKQDARNWSISVFGDDIIVPVHATAAVSALLEVFGLKVNGRKSFSRGSFRESCGGDYFRGEDVTYVKLRHDVPTSRRYADKVASAVAFRNLLYGRGLWATVRLLDEQLEKLLNWGASAPFGHPSLSRWTYLRVAPDRLSPTLHRDEIRRPRLIPLGISAEPEGAAGVLKWFISATEETERVSNPFDATERPTTFAIHSRWWAI